MGCWVWMGVGRPCPPVRNDIVTPRHFFFSFLFSSFLLFFLSLFLSPFCSFLLDSFLSCFVSFFLASFLCLFLSHSSFLILPFSTLLFFFKCAAHTSPSPHAHDVSVCDQRDLRFKMKLRSIFGSPLSLASNLDKSICAFGTFNT